MTRETFPRRSQRFAPGHRDPTALSVAGWDPCGGAGIAADLRAFRAAGAWGAAACAVVTVQSTRGVRRAEPIAALLLVAQIDDVLGDLDVRAIKTGALGSEQNVRAVADVLTRHAIASVVDPVMVPTRSRTQGARLDGDAAPAAQWALVRAATLVTPNAEEAAILLGRTVQTPRDARDAAEALVGAGARAALVKGGHVAGGDRVIDWLATRRGVVAIAGRRIAAPKLHGAGCTLSALITGRLAMRTHKRAPTDDEILAAVRWARRRMGRAIASPVFVGSGLAVLDPGRAAQRRS